MRVIRVVRLLAANWSGCVVYVVLLVYSKCCKSECKHAKKYKKFVERSANVIVRIFGYFSVAQLSFSAAPILPKFSLD